MLDARSRAGLDGACLDGIHPDALWAELMGEIAYGCFESSLYRTHDVVVIDDLFGAIIAEPHEAAAFVQERLGEFCHADERMTGDQHRFCETLGRSSRSTDHAGRLCAPTRPHGTENRADPTGVGLPRILLQVVQLPTRCMEETRMPILVGLAARQTA